MEDMDLRIEDATGDEDFYSDSPLASNKSKSSRGLQDDTPSLKSNNYDDFEPEAPARSGTSTTLESNGASSSRHALSPSHSNLTYASTSSLSLHETEDSSNTGLPLSSAPTSRPEDHSNVLDPVTYQALKRRNSEADTRRAVRERQDRTRQLDLLDRLQEQAENPHLRYVDPPNSNIATAESRPRSPLVPQSEYKQQSGIGLGSPPTSQSQQDASSSSSDVKKT